MIPVGDFQRHLIKNGCTVSPLDAGYGNLSGTGVRITKEIAGADHIRSHILQIYKDGQLSNTSAIRCGDAFAYCSPQIYFRLIFWPLTQIILFTVLNNYCHLLTDYFVPRRLICFYPAVAGFSIILVLGFGHCSG